MALIGCPECGREVSSSAAVCPECAYPVGAGTPSVPPRAKSGSTKRPWWTAVSIIGRIAAGGILFLLAEEGSVAIGLVGLLVAGSAIPTWYRHKMERLRAGWADTALADGLEDRMAEMEHRYREQMVQFEQTHTAQMTDLEERIDFAERLLTKQRQQIGPV